MEETKQVTELTESEIEYKSENLSKEDIEFGSHESSFYAGAMWAKSRSDEYWKQEIAKKDKEIAELESKLEEKDTSKITRFELIAKGVGRLVVRHELSSVELSFQDEGRTLKVFIV